jgi:hypothetical protein
LKLTVIFVTVPEADAAAGTNEIVLALPFLLLVTPA